MSRIRDIIGICFELPNVEFTAFHRDFNGIVSIDDRTIFAGTVPECYGFVSGLKFNAKAVQVHDLLERICRANIQGLNEWGDFDGAKAVAENWKKEVEEVYLSDDEVNDKATKEQR